MNISTVRVWTLCSALAVVTLHVTAPYKLYHYYYPRIITSTDGGCYVFDPVCVGVCVSVIRITATAISRFH